MVRFYQMSELAVNCIVVESDQHFPNETGGILVGAVESDCVIIQHAIGPGPMAQHRPTRFKRDGTYSQEVLDHLVKDSEGRFDYIGEWHSHLSQPNPSITDFKSMKWIALNEKYATNEPILLLCVNIGLNRWQLNCYSFVENVLKRLELING